MNDSMAVLTKPRDSSAPLLEVEGIEKSFPGVQALIDVDVTIAKGEIHGWIGENGAGKSTLIKTLAGVHRQDRGTIKVAGDYVSFSSPLDAQHAGLSFIFQELSVVDGLSVADNIMLGNELSRGPVVQVRESRELARTLLARIGFDHIEPGGLVARLSTAEKQAVMVARALKLDAQIIFMDESTAALDNEEVSRLFAVLRGLRDEGRSVVFVSHRLHEIKELADRVTIFKDGRHVATRGVSEIEIDEMVKLMVGRELAQSFPAKDRTREHVVLNAKALSTAKLRHLDLTVHSGEVVGIAGLVGAGRTEALRALFGLDQIETGQLTVKGKRVRWRHCRDAIAARIAFVPEDRRGQGIIALRSVEENLTLTWAGRFSGRAWRKSSSEVSRRFVTELRIKTPSIGQRIGLLSGGNQQKVVVARWLAVEPQILLLDEPTKGIDVGAKSEIYRLVDSLARHGLAVVLVSSELPELLGLCDRIVVMHEGRSVGELPGDCTEEDVIAMAMTPIGEKESQ